MSEATKKEIPPEKLVRVTFEPEGRTVEFEFGTMPYDHHGKPMSFLDVAENFGIFLDHACGGSCACTTCHLWIKDQEGISPADDDEIDRLVSVKQGEDLAAIREATVALDQATRRFAELMMDAAVTTAIRGKTMEAASDELSDNVTAPHPMAAAEFK